ncbi:unnamed protein product [Prunus armeniaca]|uniref:Uncharacterized protein n=1 Tax=Prunus armeniaca TaxID=36596 RepID=A0A6J5TIA1_PRUAR|nr:unnamed protein product [Prunus armeniaca]
MSGPLPDLSKRASRPSPGQRPSVDQQKKRSKHVPNAGLSLDPTDALIPGSSFDQSHHDALRRVGLATFAPLVAVKDIDLVNEPIILVDDEIWRPKFQRSDGKRLMTNKELLHDPEAFDVVLGGLLHPQDIKEWIDLDDRDFALQQTHHLILDVLKRRRKISTMHIALKFSRSLPNNFGEIGLGIADYEFIFGVIPTNIPLLGSAEYHVPPNSSDTAPSTVSHDISILNYKIEE